MSTGTVVETRDLINWGLVSSVLFPQQRGTPGAKKECTNPWCGRLVNDGHALCPYCRVRGRNDLGHVYEAFVNSGSGDRNGRALPKDSQSFLAGIAKLAYARGFIPEDFAMRFVTGGDFSGNLLDGVAEVFAHIHVRLDPPTSKSATATKRRNSSTGKPVFRSDVTAATEPILKARPLQEEAVEEEEALVENMASAVEGATQEPQAVEAKYAGPVIDAGELVAVAEAPKTEGVFEPDPDSPMVHPAYAVPGESREAETAKPAPVVLLQNVEYDGGWPTRWANSERPFGVEPDGQYAAICQAGGCTKHFAVRGAVVHGLRNARTPALCPEHRFCKCGERAVDVFHSKGVIGLESADNQPVCFRCRGSLIQRQNGLLKELLEPCPNLGQEGCYGRKRADRDESGKPLFDVCAGCKKIGRTASVNGKAVREEGQVVTPSMVPSANPALATTTATVTATAAA